MNNFKSLYGKNLSYLLFPLVLAAFNPVFAAEPVKVPYVGNDDAEAVSKLLLQAYEKEYNVSHKSVQYVVEPPKKTELKKADEVLVSDNGTIKETISSDDKAETVENAVKNETETAVKKEKVKKEKGKKFSTRKVKQKKEKLLKAAKAENSVKTENAPKADEAKKAKKMDKKPEKAALNKQKEEKQPKPKKLKNDYSEYLIPENAYKPVGNVDDKQITIQGSVSKSEQLSLGDCLELALLNNPKIQAAYANASAVKEHKVQTVSSYSPTVSSRTGITRNKPDMSGMPSGFTIPSYTKYLLGTISLSQLIYDFGITQNQYTIDKIEWEASKQNVESVVNQVLMNVKDSYYNLLYAISAKQVRYETVEQFEQMYKQAKAFYEIGTRPKVDVTIAASNLADARANYIEATNAVDLAVSKLNNAMGTPFIDPYVVDTSMPYEETDITMKSAIEIANNARPDLQIAISQMKMADEYVKLAKKTYMPKLSVSADLSMGGRSDFADKSWYSVGGYLDFPIINPVKITSEIKQAKALMKEQQFNTKATVNDIYYEIQTAYVQLNDARQKIVASKIAVEEAKESYELSKGRYKAGVCDAVELKEAQITYQSVKLAYISNVYMYNSAKAGLEKAIGQNLQPVKPQENIEI